MYTTIFMCLRCFVAERALIGKILSLRVLSIAAIELIRVLNGFTDIILFIYM